MKRDEEELCQLTQQSVRAPGAKGLPVRAAPLKRWTTVQLLKLSLLSRAQKTMKKRLFSDHHPFNNFFLTSVEGPGLMDCTCCDAHH